MSTMRAGVPPEAAVLRRAVRRGQAQKPEDSGPGSVPRSYVLKPIDGSLLYLRRGKDVRQSEAEAIQEADITLQSISLHLSSASQVCLMAGTRLL